MKALQSTLENHIRYTPSEAACRIAARKSLDSFNRPPPKCGLHYSGAAPGAWDYSGMHDICPSTAKDQHIYLRILHEACKVLGGEHKLALRLGVEVELVDRWLQGKGIPPDSVFLACLDIVNQGEGARRP